MGNKEEEETLLRAEEFKAQRRTWAPHNILFAISVLLNILFVLFNISLWAHERVSSLKSSYDEGFSTDLGPAKSQIELVTRSFTGGVNLDADGSFNMDQTGSEYIGEPSPEVDAAWDELLLGLNLDFDTSQADLGDTTFRWPESGFYFSGLDVYHSLHCLNRLRQAIYPDYYIRMLNLPHSPAKAEHIGHCINHIRQALQCHADLTPMEWKLVNEDKLILDTSTPHTCRNFDKINEWAVAHRTDFMNIKSWRNASLQIVD
ncbi:hypothetical protein F5Y18DRAFT_424412 [Xylariaceae sp. FL1019]|nr:hypothetical protein F5Y18DRAFT_424412 [Xylariaceae sp. FL1019]